MSALEHAVRPLFLSLVLASLHGAAPSAQCSTGSIVDPAAVPGAAGQFGTHVAADEGRLLVSAPGDGVVHFYRSGEGGQEGGGLYPLIEFDYAQPIELETDTGTLLGFSLPDLRGVDVDGRWAAILSDDFLFLFEEVGSSWTHASSVPAEDGFEFISLSLNTADVERLVVAQVESATNDVSFRIWEYEEVLGDFELKFYEGWPVTIDWPLDSVQSGFGRDVHLTATGHLVVGAPLRDGNGTDAGSVSIYELDYPDVTQAAEFHGAHAHARLGTTVRGYTATDDLWLVILAGEPGYSGVAEQAGRLRLIGGLGSDIIVELQSLEHDVANQHYGVELALEPSEEPANGRDPVALVGVRVGQASPGGNDGGRQLLQPQETLHVWAPAGPVQPLEHPSGQLDLASLALLQDRAVAGAVPRPGSSPSLAGLVATDLAPVVVPIELPVPPTYPLPDLPRLDVQGTFCGGSDVRIRLHTDPVCEGASEAAYVIIGSGVLDVPFQGSILLPTLDVVLSSVPEDGLAELQGSWPHAPLTGSQWYLGAWVLSSCGGGSAYPSNAIEITIP